MKRKIRAAIHAWIRDDANLTIKMTISPDMVESLVKRIVKALPPDNPPDLTEISP